MTGESPGLQRWTRRFTVASAGALVLSLLTAPVLADRSVGVLVCVFGFVCPMIFGMAYLLLPPYAGRTLVDYRIPGVHFVLAYLGAALIVAGWTTGGTELVYTAGTVLWAGGVAVFVGSLVATVGPVVLDRPAVMLQGGDRPQRSSRLATAAIPVAVGYLVVGTGTLLATGFLFESNLATVPRVVHYYLAGFGTLLVFALGARLLTGFFHVTPPRPLVWTVLVTGALAPAALGAGLWVQPWFQVGGLLMGVAMAGYLLAVALVTVRTDRPRPGLYGIAVGAVAGALAVAAAMPLALGAGWATLLALHRVFVLAGFFPLTIVGYAYQFFPPTDSRRVVTRIDETTLTLALLGVGVFLRGLGVVAGAPDVRYLGVGSAVLGAAGYAFLMARRFWLSGPPREP